MHLRFNFDACPMHSPFGFVHLTHQNLSARVLFCLNSLAKVNTQLLIYNHSRHKLFSDKLDIVLSFKHKKRKVRIYWILPTKKFTKNQMNQPYACECILRYAHTRVRCSECSCTKIMHKRDACLVRVFLVFSIQAGCKYVGSVLRVYECVWSCVYQFLSFHFCLSSLKNSFMRSPRRRLPERQVSDMPKRYGSRRVKVAHLAKSVISISFIMGYVVGLGLQNPELKIL